MLFTYQLGNFFRHTLSFSAQDLGAEILSELKVLVERVLVFRTLVYTNVYIDDVEVAIYALGHAGSTRDEILSRGTGTNTDGNAFAHPKSFAACFLLQVKLEAAINRAGHLLQSQFAKREQVSGAAKSKWDEVQAKLDEVRGSLQSPEHPIELPEFGSRLDWARERLGELRDQLPGAVQRAAEEIRSRLDSLRERVCGGKHLGYMPSFFEHVTGTLQTMYQHAPDSAKNSIDAARQKAEELHDQLTSGVADLRQRLDAARAAAPSFVQKRLIDSVRDRLAALGDGTH